MGKPATTRWWSCLAIIAAIIAVIAPAGPVGAAGESSGGRPGAGSEREAAAAPAEARAHVETVPVGSERDAADDVAVWVHPTDPEQSVVIGTDKRAVLEVYDLSGRRIQRLRTAAVPANNVDLRAGFPLAGAAVPLVATAGGGLRFFRLDPSTRRLADVTPAGTPTEPFSEAGVCLYRSPASGRFYAFTTGPDGWVVQWALSDGGGVVTASPVRAWQVGSRLESCVVDDERSRLYVSEERVGIWEYGAEEDSAVFPRILIDATAPAGRLAADVEGLAVVAQPGGGGYLLASSQGDNSFAVYRRGGDHAFLGKFRVVDGDAVDGCSDTDGIEATPEHLGRSFPAGIFICQDGRNTAPGSAGRQNFKFLRLEDVLAAASSPAGAP